MIPIFKFFKRAKTQLQIVRRDESKLRLSEWQTDPALCSLAAKTLADPNLQLILSVLKNEHPSKHALPLGASLEDRAVMQARAEGYEMFLANMERMALNTAPVPAPEAVFEPEFFQP